MCMLGHGWPCIMIATSVLHLMLEMHACHSSRLPFVKLQGEEASWQVIMCACRTSCELQPQFF